MYVTMTSSQMYNFVIVYTFEMIFCFEKNFLGSQYIPNKYLFVHLGTHLMQFHEILNLKMRGQDTHVMHRY